MAERSILITGCSSGIGAHAARSLRQRGWRVFATARAQEDVDRLAADGAEALRLDHAAPASMDAALAKILARTGGRLDALFNNGAYALPAPLEDVPTEALRALFEANFFGWHHLTRAAIPVMRAQGQGRIVMCSSVLGFVPARWRGAYTASKFALEAYTDTLRMEMAPTGIKVISIQPGPIRTELRRKAVQQFERWIDWEASARAEQYRAELLDQLYHGSSGSAFERGPEAVTAKLLQALEHPRPRARYKVTGATYLMAAARRVLPRAALHALCARA